MLCSCAALNMNVTRKADYGFIEKERNYKDDAAIVVVAFPEEIVATTPDLYSEIMPLFGFGRDKRVRAGHIGLVIAKEGESEFKFFDVGRYIAPVGHSRVRGANTDPEQTIVMDAEWDGKLLKNAPDLLLWLEKHPEVTCGEGALYASVSESVDYERTMRFINHLQDMEIFSYGPFVREGSNCTRFVADALHHGVSDEKIVKRIRAQYGLTPSCLSNVEAANSYDKYYVVRDGSLSQESDNLSRIQRSLIMDWGRDFTERTLEGTMEAPTDVEHGEDWRWLAGAAKGGWFDVKPTIEADVVLVSKYDPKAHCDYRTYYRSAEPLTLTTDYQMDYPSTFEVVTLLIDGQKVRLERVEGSARYEE